MIEDGKVHLRRVAYDIDATIAHLRESGIDADAVEMAEAALRSGGRLPLKLLKNGEDLSDNGAV
jgi:hypothetical protein